MLTEFIRVLRRDDDDMTDLSMENAESSGITWDDLDWLYVAQRHPFNNLFMKMATPSKVTGNALSAEYWDGTEWRAVTDLLDFTKGLTRNGMIQYGLQRDHSWQCVEDTSDSAVGQCPAELEGLNIDQCYWLRLKLASPPTQPAEDDPSTVDDPDTEEVENDESDPGTVISRICYAFTTTKKIESIEIDAPKFRANWGIEAKADWLDEILTASEIMVTEMKSGGLIKAPGQLILLDDISLACAYKTLFLIYFNMGKAYDEKRADVVAGYRNFLSGLITVDKDSDGKIDNQELSGRQASLVR